MARDDRPDGGDDTVTAPGSRRAVTRRDPRDGLPAWRPIATAVLVLGMVSAACACSRETSGSPAASSPAASNGPPSTPGETSAPSPRGAGPARRCPPWVDAASLVATSQAGRRDFFRKFEYDFASGVLHVHDSDPFPTGQEASQPRVTDETTTLSGGSKDRIEQALFAVCPGPEAMARRCAPGGCQRLTVTDHSGNVSRIEDAPTVRAVMREFVASFPKLRAP